MSLIKQFIRYIFAIVRRTTASSPTLQLDSRPYLTMGHCKFSKLAVT